MATGRRMAIFIGYDRLVVPTVLDRAGKPCSLSFTHEEMYAEAAQQQ